MNEHEQPNKTNPDRSGRPMIWLVAALIGVAAVVLLALWPRREPPVVPRPAASVAPSPETAPAVSLDSPRAPTPSTADAPRVPVPSSATALAPLPPYDFFPSDAPEVLRKAHDVTASGGVLAMGRLKDLYQFGKDHPGDARPHLVMAEDAVNRGWDEFAVGHYVRAQHEDPRAKQDPQMLKDLVSIAGDKSGGAKASSALVDIYGPAAIAAVEEALARAGDKGDAPRVERLVAVSQSLTK